MFQNITQSAEEQENQVNKVKIIFKELWKVQNIVLFILTFCVSTLSIEGEIMPFGLAMVAATLSSGVPVFGVLTVAAVGTLIGNGTVAFLNFVLSSMIYFALVLIFKPKVAVEERNEIVKTGKRLWIACFIVTFFQNVKGIVLTYDVFMAIVAATLTYVFYKVFVNRTCCYKGLEKQKSVYIRRINGSIDSYCDC